MTTRIALAAFLCTLLGVAVTFGQDPAPAAALKASAGVIALDPVIVSRNAAETPDPFPAPTAVSKPHILVWTRVESSRVVAGSSPARWEFTYSPFVIGAERVGEITPTLAGSAYDPALYSQVNADPPWGGGVIVVGNCRNLAAEVAFALGRKAVSFEREVR